MAIAENKALVRSLFEAINAGNLARIYEVFAADFVDRSTAEQVPGPDGVQQYFTRLRAALPDLYITIDDLIAEDEKVVVRTTWRGTYEGSSSAGRQVARTMIQMFRIVNNKIQEEWNEGADLL